MKLLDRCANTQDGALVWMPRMFWDGMYVGGFEKQLEDRTRQRVFEHHLRGTMQPFRYRWYLELLR